LIAYQTTSAMYTIGIFRMTIMKTSSHAVRDIRAAYEIAPSSQSAPDISPVTPEELDSLRDLLGEYAAALPFDLGFQGFDEELRGLPGAYAPPAGALLAARVGERIEGCVALRRLDDTGYDIAELKRLYVRPALRGSGVGRLLVEAAVAEARRLGYARLRLDTTPQMAAAAALYTGLGFRDIPPYRDNPIPGARFLELTL
jgi:putative acetyltransferase